ncbi:hypothetical protein [Mycobacterium bohemicum]|uniref:hypothetical protein n=1 Tax=Mycobacterium bohemicum TaxID=56425 RepID=UPI001BAB4DDD
MSVAEFLVEDREQLALGGGAQVLVEACGAGLVGGEGAQQVLDPRAQQRLVLRLPVRPVQQGLQFVGDVVESGQRTGLLDGVGQFGVEVPGEDGRRGVIEDQRR